MTTLGTRPWFNYPLLNYEVTDGDTVKVTVDLGFYMDHRVKIRLANCDAPETRLLYSKQAGLHVKRAVSTWLAFFKGRDDSQLLVTSAEIDAKYANRVIGDVVAWWDPVTCLRLSDYLLESKLARPYHGEKRELWLHDELQEILDVNLQRALDTQLDGI